MGKTRKPKYIVNGVKLIIGEGYSYADPVPDDEAELWGVYRTKANGEKAWVADFAEKDDAHIFAQIKNTRKGG